MPIVAIVDDDKAMREAIFDLLQVEGLSARTFDSAAAFLADYAPDRFDCLITDVRMPGIDGLELQQKLRTLGSTMPVIVMTSSTDEATRVRALDGGATAYFTKPVADEVLLSQLRAALEGNAAPDDKSDKRSEA
jgi:FixJ family two-component response regulator